jgi:hypothetical protein
MIKTKPLNIRKIKPLIENIVEQKLYEILGDSDEGLDLKPSIKRRLKNSIKKNRKGIPAKISAEKLGLKW